MPDKPKSVAPLAPPQSLEAVLLSKLRAILDEPTPAQRLNLPNSRNFPLEMPDGSTEDAVVPAPPSYQPYPEVRGGHHLAQMVDRLLQVAPSLQGMIKSVQYGPTDDMLELIGNWGRPEKAHFLGQELEGTNILGATNPVSRRISLNPSTDLRSGNEGAEPILAHEAAHTAGWGHQSGKPDEAAGLMEQLLRARVGK